jgi:hypothetical protein
MPDSAGSIRAMRRLYILLSVTFLVGTLLLVVRSELNAQSRPVTECGFWSDMEAGLSCQ